MGNGSLRFKDNSGNVISFISGSGTDIVISGGTLNLLGMTEVALGNVTISGSTLVNGTQGNQGPQGMNGFQGPTGLQGTNGTVGTQGNQGSQGNQGPTGLQGDTGFQGNQGPTGLQGTNGLQGTVGTQGNQGPIGLQGFQGPQGNQGTTGASAGITSYTNQGDNRILTSVNSTTINAESNLTFDGSILTVSLSSDTNYATSSNDNNTITLFNGSSNGTNTIYSGLKFTVGALGGVIPGGEGTANIYAIRRGSNLPSTDLSFILKGGGVNENEMLERLRIKWNGRVGIGTSSPSYLLDVNGTLGVTGTATFSSSVSTGGSFYSFIAGQTALRTYTKAAQVELVSYQSVSGYPYTKTTDLVANADSGAESQFRLLTAEVGGNPTTRLTIASTGVATFSSSVNSGTSLSSGNALTISNSTNSRQFQFGYSTGAGYNYFQVYDGTSFQPLNINNTMHWYDKSNIQFIF